MNASEPHSVLLTERSHVPRGNCLLVLVRQVVEVGTGEDIVAVVDFPVCESDRHCHVIGVRSGRVSVFHKARALQDVGEDCIIQNLNN